MFNDTPETGLDQIFWSSSLETEPYSIKWILHKCIYGLSAPPEVMKACQAGANVSHTKAWLVQEKKTLCVLSLHFILYIRLQKSIAKCFRNPGKNTQTVGKEALITGVKRENCKVWAGIIQAILHFFKLIYADMNESTEQWSNLMELSLSLHIPVHKRVFFS